MKSDLRAMLGRPGIICAPGAYDVLSAVLIEKAGFPAVYMTGYGASASVLGMPDIGLITGTEMATLARNMAGAVGVPVIADADNGYGDVLNVIRTVREYEASGVAAIQLEDQVLPKRCGHMEGKQLVPKEEMVRKIRAAVLARHSDRLVIIARTDAIAVNGLEDAIERSRAYAAAGADVLFVEAPRNIDEMRTVVQSIDKPLIANMVEKGKTPSLSVDELERIGFKIVIFPVSALYAAAGAVMKLLHCLKEDGSSRRFLNQMVTFAEFNSVVGLERLRSLEKTLE